MGVVYKYERESSNFHGCVSFTFLRRTECIISKNRINYFVLFTTTVSSVIVIFKMHITKFLLGALLAGVGLAVPKAGMYCNLIPLHFLIVYKADNNYPDTSIFARSLGLCKSPSCTSQCPDGTYVHPSLNRSINLTKHRNYDCCVTYVRDPCADHQKCEYSDCICECENIP
jgi:hypothetical protein